MAGIADLIALLAILLGVCIEHVWWVRKIVAGIVVAEALTMALVAFLFFGFRNAAMFDGPAEIGMGGGNRSNDDRRFDQQVVPPAYDRDGVTKVAFDTDDFQLVS